MFKSLSKQNNKKIFKAFSILLIAGVLISVNSSRVIGQTADELAQQKQDKQQQLDAINKKIASYQTEIKQKQAQANTLKNTLAIIDLQIAEAVAQIEATEEKIDVTNLEIAEVTEKIIQTERNVAKQKEVLRSLVTDINDLDLQSPLEIALANDNFQEFIDQIEYVSSIQQDSQEALVKIKKLKTELALRQSDLKKEKSNLDNLLVQLDTSKVGLDNQRKDKQAVLNQTKGVEQTYQKLLAASKAEQDALAKEVIDLDNAIAAKLGKSKLLKPIHGLLAYPMEGTLTQGYGNTGFTALGYNFHNGLDIAGPAGTPIYAAGDGVVEATGTGQGAYGNWVVIRHGSGKFAAHPIMTLYGHMTSFRVSKGQAVAMGDLVGFEGNTGNTTRLIYGPHRGFHLHFTVFEAEGFGVAPGANTKTFGPYQVPYGATYNPLDFL